MTTYLPADSHRLWLKFVQLQRLSAAAENNIEVPAVKAGRPEDFFDMICAKTMQGSLLPTWRGELYFELHRGVSPSPHE